MPLRDYEINIDIKVSPFFPYKHSLILPLSLESFYSYGKKCLHTIRSLCLKVSHIYREDNNSSYYIKVHIFIIQNKIWWDSIPIYAKDGFIGNTRGVYNFCFC